MTALECLLSEDSSVCIARDPQNGDILIEFQRSMREGEEPAPGLTDGRLAPGQGQWSKDGRLFTLLKISENAAYGLTATLMAALGVER